MGDWCISVFGEMMDKSVLGNAAGLFEAGHSFPNFHVHVLVVDKVVKFVGVNDFLCNFVKAYAHVFVAGYWGTVVEVADLASGKAGSGCGYGAVD